MGTCVRIQSSGEAHRAGEISGRTRRSSASVADECTFTTGSKGIRERCNSCGTNRATRAERIDLKQRMVSYKGGRCATCGYDSSLAALCFHHRNANEKAFSVAGSHNRTWAALRHELDKCDLLCRNCHAELHAAREDFGRQRPRRGAADRASGLRSCTRCGREYEHDYRKAILAESATLAGQIEGVRWHGGSSSASSFRRRAVRVSCADIGDALPRCACIMWIAPRSCSPSREAISAVRWHYGMNSRSASWCVTTVTRPCTTHGSQPQLHRHRYSRERELCQVDARESQARLSPRAAPRDASATISESDP
jgi:hypothetical protein